MGKLIACLTRLAAQRLLFVPCPASRSMRRRSAAIVQVGGLGRVACTAIVVRVPDSVHPPRRYSPLYTPLLLLFEFLDARADLVKLGFQRISLVSQHLQLLLGRDSARRRRAISPRSGLPSGGHLWRGPLPGRQVLGSRTQARRAAAKPAGAEAEAHPARQPGCIVHPAMLMSMPHDIHPLSRFCLSPRNGSHPTTTDVLAPCRPRPCPGPKSHADPIGDARLRRLLDTAHKARSRR
jgi:hypothetical protein